MARILVVDDEPHILEVVRAYLAREGHEVTTAADGETAFERARADGPDVIVLDVMLPRRSGFDVLRDLRAAGSTAAVIMLTAATTSSTGSPASRSGRTTTSRSRSSRASWWRGSALSCAASTGAGPRRRSGRSST